MKKSLLALAIAGAVSTPALAATSNVDVYGKFNVSVDIVDRDIVGQEDEFRIADGSSRIGFKGSEDLGGSLSAIWQIESAVAMDGGGGTFGTRNTFVGLSSKALGTVKVGRNDTSYKNATGKYDVFGDSLADYNTIMGSDSFTGGTDFNEREANSVIYTTPNLMGLVGSVTYAQRHESGTGNSVSATADPQLYAFSLNYANGPLSLAAAYEAIDDDVNSIGGVPSLTDGDAWKLGGGYAFGNTRVAAVFERIQFEEVGGPFDYERDAWYLSGTHKLGAITLKAAYGMADDGDTNAGSANDGADFWALGVDYALSKRTKLFAFYTSLENDANGDFVLGDGATNGSVAAGPGGDPSGVSLGVSHSF